MVSRFLAESESTLARECLGFIALVVTGCAPAANPAPEPPSPPVIAGTTPEETDGPTSLPERRSTGDMTNSADAWVGVELRKAHGGVVISYVLPGGPAALAGVLPGDLWLRVGSQPIIELDDVHLALEAVAVGETVPLVARRGGDERLFRLVVAAKPTRQELMTAIYVGQAAPSISSLTTLRGTVVPSLQQLRGNVVILEFWASFCVACRAITVDLNRWNREREVLGLRVLGITMDPIEVAESAVSSFEMEYSVHLDTEGEVTRAFRGTALPTLFLIDRGGIVRDVVVGNEPSRLERLHALAGELLRRP